MQRSLVHTAAALPPVAGQEECLICYSIVQHTSGQLPRLRWARVSAVRAARLALPAGLPAHQTVFRGAQPTQPSHCVRCCAACSCRTCRKRFHGGCLYKWFKSSGKSTCPHCQSPW